MRSEAASRMTLEVLRYSQVWEDHLLLERGLGITSQDDVLSIGSAGDNVFHLALLAPRSVTAIDMSPVQSALISLKIAAIQHFSHDEFLTLLGFRDGDRLALFERLAPHLSDDVRAIWLARREDIAMGLSYSGRLERYFRAFLTEITARFVPSTALDALFAAQTLDEQRAIFSQHFSGSDYQSAFQKFFGRESMEQRGRDPAQMRYVQTLDVGAIFWQRFHKVCTTLPTRGNFYLEQALSGTYRDLTLAPPYLLAENYSALRAALPRISIITDELERHLTSSPQGRYSKANLSDIFEYMSDSAANGLYALFAERFRTGGKIAYWNLLVPRSRPEHLSHKLIAHRELGEQLLAQDRSFFYGAFCVEEIS